MELTFTGIIVTFELGEVVEFINDISFDCVISPADDYDVSWRSLMTKLYKSP